MNSARYLELLAELAEIERMQEDLTLSHSDQQLLDQAWEDIINEMESLDQIQVVAHEISEEEQQEINAWVDDRTGCENCAGCIYCLRGEGTYDGADEV